MKDLIGDMGWGGTLMFQAVLLGMLLAPLLHAGFLMVLLLHVVTGQLAWPAAQPWPIACLVVLIAGHASAIAINLVGLVRTGQGRLWLWQALVPVYWLLIALATLRALREFAQRPFHWFKSPHSVTRPPSVETPKTSREAAYPAGNIAQRLGRKAIWDRSTAG